MIENVMQLGEHFPRFLWEILMAVICGGLIGVERELRGPGGLRNNVLLCLATVLYMIVAELITFTHTDSITSELVTLSGYIVIGVAIFSAAVIIHNANDTNAVGRAGLLWVVAGIGLMIGTGHTMFALLITGITLLTLTLTNTLESNLKSRTKPLLLKLTIREDSEEARTKLRAILERYKVQADTFRSENAPYGVKITLTSQKEPENVLNFIAELWTLSGIIEVEH